MTDTNYGAPHFELLKDDGFSTQVPAWVQLSGMNDYQRLFCGLPEERQLRLLRGAIKSHALELLLRGIGCRDAFDELVKVVRSAWSFGMLSRDDVNAVVEDGTKLVEWRGVWGDNPYEKRVLQVVWKLVRDEFSPWAR
jgi:hypothetical protein